MLDLNKERKWIIRPSILFCDISSLKNQTCRTHFKCIFLFPRKSVYCKAPKKWGSSLSYGIVLFISAWLGWKRFWTNTGSFVWRERIFPRHCKQGPVLGWRQSARAGFQSSLWLLWLLPGWQAGSGTAWKHYLCSTAFLYLLSNYSIYMLIVYELSPFLVH